MTRLVSHLAHYAAYHRDRRNVATHLIGIPLIVLAAEVLLSRPVMVLGDLSMTPAEAASLAAVLFYLRLDLAFGLVMAAVLALGAWAGLWIAGMPTSIWLSAGVGMFVVGWIFQFAGHAWEGRRPAFVDDLVGLLIGPVFVVAELAFHLGLRDETRRAVAKALARQE